MNQRKFVKMADGEDSGAKIKIVIKTPQGKKDVEVDGGADVKEVLLMPSNIFYDLESELTPVDGTPVWAVWQFDAVSLSVSRH